VKVYLWLSRIVAAPVLAAIAILTVLGVRAPWSPSGWILLAALGLLAARMFVRALRPRLLLWALGFVSFAAVMTVRLLSSGAPNVMLTLPGATSSRWLGRIVDEQDVSLLGSRVLAWRWPLTADERDGLAREMRAAYVEMRGETSASPSPVLDTAFGRQHPDAFDTLVFETPGRASSTAVVFLHGFGGSFRLECWLVARAARAIDAAAVA